MKSTIYKKVSMYSCYIVGFVLLNKSTNVMINEAMFFLIIVKGYCMSSRINCGMAKSLAQARACSF